MSRKLTEKVVLKQKLDFDPVEHDAEKACPGHDPGWKPVFGKDRAQTRS